MGNTAFLEALTFAWWNAVRCSFSPDDSTTFSDRGGSVESQSTWHIYHNGRHDYNSCKLYILVVNITTSIHCQQWLFT